MKRLPMHLTLPVPCWRCECCRGQRYEVDSPNRSSHFKSHLSVSAMQGHAVQHHLQAALHGAATPPDKLTACAVR